MVASAIEDDCGTMTAANDELSSCNGVGICAMFRNPLLHENRCEFADDKVIISSIYLYYKTTH